MAKRYSGTVTFDIVYSGSKAPPFSKGHSGIHTPSTGQYRVRVYHAGKHVETFYYHEKPAIISKKGVDSPEMYDEIGTDAANSIVHSGPEGLVGHLHLNQNGRALVSRTHGGKRQHPITSKPMTRQEEEAEELRAFLYGNRHTGGGSEIVAVLKPWAADSGKRHTGGGVTTHPLFPTIDIRHARTANGFKLSVVVKRHYNANWEHLDTVEVKHPETRGLAKAVHDHALVIAKHCAKATHAKRVWLQGSEFTREVLGRPAADEHENRRHTGGKKSVVDILAERRRKAEDGNWVPASGGTEEPFVTRTRRRLQYLWQPSTGRHAYIDLDTDIILSDEEALAALAIY